MIEFYFHSIYFTRFIFSFSLSLLFFPFSFFILSIYFISKMTKEVSNNRYTILIIQFPKNNLTYIFTSGTNLKCECSLMSERTRTRITINLAKPRSLFGKRSLVVSIKDSAQVILHTSAEKNLTISKENTG